SSRSKSRSTSRSTSRTSRNDRAIYITTSNLALPTERLRLVQEVIQEILRELQEMIEQFTQQ
ncbi:3186_t:CDS:2, partial [Entrophospora sp. SA101]